MLAVTRAQPLGRPDVAWQRVGSVSPDIVRRMRARSTCRFCMPYICWAAWNLSVIYRNIASLSASAAAMLCLRPAFAAISRHITATNPALEILDRGTTSFNSYCFSIFWIQPRSKWSFRTPEALRFRICLCLTGLAARHAFLLRTLSRL